MKVVDQVPMPRARIPQVSPADFQALLERVEKLEKEVNNKEKRNGNPNKQNY